MNTHNDYLFRGDLVDLDPAVSELIELESERQAHKLIMIPSESSSPLAVRQALGSSLNNIYAEGYPNADSRWLTEPEILDYDHHLAHYRRYGDQRYYRGVEYADVIEALARRRCAEAFATDTVGAGQIYVNVQPLSGAPANIAVQNALLKPGDTIMGMTLAHGGHLTHGSPVNLSGQLFDVAPYSVDERTERLDYDMIEALAIERRPKMIIAGYTSYPHSPDWARFRQIADRVGAYLLADIAHVAGMVIAGAYPTPLGYADVITFTTHKTLCGPRGACILTTSPALARKIDHAVFPGLQGGPHVNTFAGIAVALHLAQTDQFRQLQHQIVSNAAALSQALTARGMRVPCGGTDTHLLLLDCKTIQGQDGTPLMGGVTAAILDLIGIVVNRNTIPGDESAVHPSGIRLGAPWLTQRGMREPDMDQIADIIARALRAIEPFTYATVSNLAYRGKIDFDVMEQLREEVAEIAERIGADSEFTCSGYPHHCVAQELRPREGGFALIEIEGNRAPAFVEQVVVEQIDGLPQSAWRTATLLERDGTVMSSGWLKRAGQGHTRYHLAVPSDRARRVIAWLRHLSDGFVRFDDRDVWAKILGPVVVRDLGMADLSDISVQAGSTDSGFVPQTSHKPYFIGLHTSHYREPSGVALPPFEWQNEEGELRHTPLFDWHTEHGAKMAPFAGWEMPLWYTSISEEHRAVREAAGLFDVSHMGLFEISGPHAAHFLNLVTTNDANALRPGESQYAYLLAPNGHVLDDLMIYMISPARYLMIVNAANAEKDWAWLNAVNTRQVRIDETRPWVRASFQAQLRDLHTTDASHAWLSGIALQGPRARDVLFALLDSATPSAAVTELRGRLKAMKHTQLMEAHFPSERAPGGAFDVIVTRTGYTGERMSYELLIHPDVLQAFWEQLLEVGGPLGLQPIGLGARDSLRIEAGLPLYGHELAGPFDLRPDDAGFAGYVKLHKAFFVGRQAYMERARERKMIIARFRVQAKGVRVPKTEDVITDSIGRVIGHVTSCALDTEGHLVGMAYIDQRRAARGSEINILSRPAREAWNKPYDDLRIGDRLVVPIRASVVRRFPKR
ncbi:MAG: glycine cleavage system aminomethyltransferase GcvT [Chloroflexi bacterium]|nr:glycine cleavage system aminomethyltransferase GcvT [Chloroflexota bacterium]